MMVILTSGSTFAIDNEIDTSMLIPCTLTLDGPNTDIYSVFRVKIKTPMFTAPDIKSTMEKPVLKGGTQILGAYNGQRWVKSRIMNQIEYVGLGAVYCEGSFRQNNRFLDYVCAFSQSRYD